MSVFPVAAGMLACQKNSYLRTLKATVVECMENIPVQAGDGGEMSSKKSKKEKKSKSTPAMNRSWNVVLSDTVLFPEGGGQPADFGTIGGIEVFDVQNKNGVPVHSTSAPLNVGDEVDVNVDWGRRWDHMQQHSGQHLVTAKAIELFGYETESWNLGDTISFLDLATAELTSDELSTLESSVNDAITTGHDVTPRWIEPTDPEMEKIRCRGLPEDVTGAVRVLEIDGIDKNLCCGTHVQTTAHLQAIKLLKAEKAKKSTRVYFICGKRLLDYMGDMFSRQQSLTTILTSPPEKHVEEVQDLSKRLRDTDKKCRALGKELGHQCAQSLLMQYRQGVHVLVCHRDAGDIEWMKAVAGEVESEAAGAVVFLTFGDEAAGSDGMFMLCGPADIVKVAGPKAAAIMSGRGGGRGRYQGKVTKLSARKEAIEILTGAMEAGTDASPKSADS
eukprot:m.196485 g.196485  ORF g.196485 m.196485 type:complete len:445 (+) comp18693_c0_seq2:189-1523(+)